MASSLAVTYTFVQGSPSSGPEVNTNFGDIVSWVNTNAPTLDGAKAFTGAVTLPGNPSGALQAAPKQYVDAIIPIGSILGYGGSVMPNSSWLQCNGQQVSRSTYATLFGIIGTTYGVGNGSTTFNLPNLSARAPMGPGVSPTGVTRSPGQTYGADSHTMISANLIEHLHGSGSLVDNPTGNHLHSPQGGQNFVRASPSGGTQALSIIAGSGAVDLVAGTDAPGNHQHFITGNTANAGLASPTPIPTLPPVLIINYMIKVL